MDDAICVSRSTNTFEKGTNPIIIPKVIDK